MHLPEYQPPEDRAAGTAAGVAPLLVLLAFTGVVLQWLTLPAAAAAMATTALWLATEMHRYQRAVDRYNLDYVHHHLAWRNRHTLAELAQAPQLAPATRDFVRSYLAARR